MTYDDYIRKLQKGGPNYYIIDVIFENYMDIGQLIRKCCMPGHCRAFDYNLSSNNCQDFIAKVIEILKVKRKCSYTHKSALVNIPPCILRALEKNEDKGTLRFFQSLSIIGNFVEVGAQVAELSDEVDTFNVQVNELNAQITEIGVGLDKVNAGLDKFNDQATNLGTQLGEVCAQKKECAGIFKESINNIKQIKEELNNISYYK